MIMASPADSNEADPHYEPRVLAAAGHSRFDLVQCMRLLDLARYQPLLVKNYLHFGEDVFQVPPEHTSITEVIMDKSILFFVLHQDWSEMDRSDQGSIFRSVEYDDKQAVVEHWGTITDGDFLLLNDNNSNHGDDDDEIVQALSEWHRAHMQAYFQHTSASDLPPTSPEDCTLPLIMQRILEREWFLDVNASFLIERLVRDLVDRLIRACDPEHIQQTWDDLNLSTFGNLALCNEFINRHIDIYHGVYVRKDEDEYDEEEAEEEARLCLELMHMIHGYIKNKHFCPHPVPPPLSSDSLVLVCAITLTFTRFTLGKTKWNALCLYLQHKHVKRIYKIYLSSGFKDVDPDECVPRRAVVLTPGLTEQDHANYKNDNKRVDQETGYSSKDEIERLYGTCP
eukprot:TRINITY_DN19002_c0_g1_i1.p1 TRINITY_DN19002_c0_g1~~TRINITY_DN19002_c0_g1_i1.p1  ORF type:complete len:397 (+),score=65.26 TRINITY_DN19002_c0_g1_i1:144-1334(+)